MEISPFTIDLHTHTTLTDGHHTPEEMIQTARACGITIGISDHVDTPKYMKTDREVSVYFNAIKDLPAFRSVEMSVEPKLQISRQVLDLFDYTIAATHQVAGYSIFDVNYPVGDTAALLNTFIEQVDDYLSRYPFAILGHPTLLPVTLHAQAREIWTRPDMIRLIETVQQHGTALEINARSMTPHEEFIALASEMGAQFSVGSDSHRKQSLGKLGYPHAMIRKYHIPPERIFIPTRKEPL